MSVLILSDRMMVLKGMCTRSCSQLHYVLCPACLSDLCILKCYPILYEQL